MSNVVSEAMLKRIRSLLAMSRGNANENEAAVAAQKVQELLTQYNLSLSDVEQRDEAGKIIEDGDLMTGSSNPWRRDLALACARLYLCDYYWHHVRFETSTRKCGYVRGDRHNFIGLPHNVVVAKEMFVYLVDTVERLAKESRKAKNQTHPYEHAFRHGCAMRLVGRLWERYYAQSEPPAGLLVKSNVPALYKGMDARIGEYMAKNHSDLAVRTNRGKHSSWAGVMDGNKAGDTIGLDDQVGVTKPTMIGSE
jgi:hypothetical protein